MNSKYEDEMLEITKEYQTISLCPTCGVETNDDNAVCFECDSYIEKHYVNFNSQGRMDFVDPETGELQTEPNLWSKV